MKNILLIIFVVIIEISIASAQPIIFQAQVDKKTAQDGAANNYFGSAVAIDSITIMIGSIGYDNYRGGVYVFTKTDSGWFQTQFLTDQNSVPGEFFGNAIDIKENTAAIAGYGRRVVLIYQNVSGYWTYRSTIYLEESHYWFGQSVHINHYNSILVGCPADVWAGTGRAYLYSFNATWSVANIFYSPVNSRIFGSAVCFVPDTVPAYLIGDHLLSYNNVNGLGKVYLEVWNGATWTEYTFTPSDPQPGANYGWAIESPNSSTIIISAYNYGIDTLSGQGAVYVYKYNPSLGWSEVQKILSPEPKGNAHFGNSISAHGDKLLIGAFYEDNYKGVAYLYRWQNGGYVFQKKIEAEDGEANDQFGVSVGLFGNSLVIGAHQDNVNNNINCGSTYLFTPLKLGEVYGLNFFASIVHSGAFSIDTSTINDPGQLPRNTILHSTKTWSINSDNVFDFQDGMIGADLSTLNKKNNFNNNLCWLKRTNENSPWEYIGGTILDNHLYNTVPFNSLSQFIIADLVDTATYVKDDNLFIEDFKLYQNHPNPFNPSTKIKYSIPDNVILSGANNLVRLKVYDILGNEITTLVDEYKPAGEYEVEFNATTLPSGVYFYQLKVGEYVETKKMILLK